MQSPSTQPSPWALGQPSPGLVSSITWSFLLSAFLTILIGHLESSPATTPMLSHDQFSMSHGSEASLTPPSTTRSLTSSPPRVSLTPQQRELKRQQDRVRRDSRLTQRIRRTNSNNSFVDSPPPMSMSDVTSAMSMSSYTTAPAPISLLTEPATSMATPPYIPSYSPSLSEQHQGSQVFQTAYQPM